MKKPNYATTKRDRDGRHMKWFVGIMLAMVITILIVVTIGGAS